MSTVTVWPGDGGTYSVACGTGGPFYVATTGSDTTGIGTSSRPWATIEKARASIDAAGILPAMDGDVLVNVAPGNYYLSTTITFDANDSGTGGHRVAYRCSGDVGTARLVGGTLVTGWVAHSGSIKKANVGAGLTFSTLYENGVRATKARYPKYVPSSTYDSARDTYLTTVGVNTSHLVLGYNPAQLTPDAWDLTDAQIVVWSGGGQIGGHINWFTDTIPILSQNTAADTFTFAAGHESRYELFAGGAGSRFFIQGVLDLLTEAGEFHYDSVGGWLYYWPRTAPIASQEIILPAVRKAVAFDGASNITFDGFEIACTDFAPWYRHASVNDNDRGGGAYDRQYSLTEAQYGAIYMEDAVNITVSRCHIKGSGFSGIFMRSQNTGHVISNCWIEHSGHSGIYMDGNYPGQGDVITLNTVENCRFNDMGELAGSGAAIWCMQSSNNTFSHLEISNCPRGGFFILAYTGYLFAQIYAEGNLLEYTSIDGVCQDSGDVGGLYIGFLSSSVSGGPYKTNTVNQVTITDCNATPTMLDQDPNGCFWDDESRGQVLSNVQVSNTQGAGCRLNNTGNMTATNCTFLADGTANGSFNPALMSSAIGLTAEFPY